jgi:ribosomal protein S18 acetylase RimI-like enzyme
MTSASPHPLRALYDDEMRRRIVAPPGLAREDRGPLTWMLGPRPHPLDHMVAHSRMSATDADATIARVVDDARRGGYGVSWGVHAHDDPTDLASRLGRHGFVDELGPESILVLDARDPRLDALPAPGVTIRRIEREADVGDVVAINEAVWGPDFTPWLLRWYRGAWAGEADPIGVYVADVDGVAAGTAWVAPHRGRSFASFFGATVLPAFRGRGAYRALVAARARFARESGSHWLVVGANDQSAPRLARVGFVRIATKVDMVLRAPRPVSAS